MNKSGTPSGLGFYGAFALKGGTGQSSSEGGTLMERDHFRYGGELSAGLRLGRFLFGVVGEYNLWRQRTKTSEVNDSNMAGTQIQASPLAGIALGPFLLQLRLPLYSTMKLQEKTSSGEEVVYLSPKLSSYSAQLNYKIGAKSSVGLEYTSTLYSKVEVAGEESKLASNDLVNYQGLGIVYGFMF